MKFYHFTYPYRVKQILEEGLIDGDVPLSINTGFNAPWITRDPNPTNQKWTGFDNGKGKSGARLTINMPEDAPYLLWWPAIAKVFNVEEWWYKALDKTGGGGSENWFIYLGIIPPEWISEEAVWVLNSSTLPQNN